jgi:regulatory protein YycI of two-component signal transduction system YycFG
MAVGLATGMGFIGVGALFAVIMIVLNIIYSAILFNKKETQAQELKITVPEGLDYYNLFDDLFEKYASSYELLRVKTASMGSLYSLTYKVNLKDLSMQKEFIDEIRCRNGNLDISLGRPVTPKEEL